MPSSSAAPLLHAVTIATALVVIAPPSAAAQSTRADRNLTRFTISAGLEPWAEDESDWGSGAFLAADFALSPRWSIGYSATNRFGYSHQSGVREVFTGATMRAPVVIFQPARWCSVYAGPAVTIAHLTVADRGTNGSTSDRTARPRSVGGVSGATLRLHDRPYRFYMLRAHWAWVPRQTATKTSDWNIGVGLGLTF